MTTKAQKRKRLAVQSSNNEDKERPLADLVLGPALAALRVVFAAEGETGTGAKMTVTAGKESLVDRCAAIHQGDMRLPESMLMSQAIAMQSLAARLAELGMAQSRMPHMDSLLRLSLRAQNQSRMTLETLATIKNPPAVYARQANVTTGPQQINNGLHAGVRDIPNAQNKLLEQTNGERLEPGAPGETIGSNPPLAAVGSVHGTKD